jgi:CHAT domain-containing protein
MANLSAKLQLSASLSLCLAIGVGSLCARPSWAQFIYVPPTVVLPQPAPNIPPPVQRPSDPTPGCVADCGFAVPTLPSPGLNMPTGSDPMITIDPGIVGHPSLQVTLLDSSYTKDFSDHLGFNPNAFPEPDLDEIQLNLNLVAEASGIRPAIIYVSFVPPTATDMAPAAPKEASVTTESAANSATTQPGTPLVARGTQPGDLLELILITPGRPPVRRTVSVTQAEVQSAANDLRREVTNRSRLHTTSYLSPAQDLYQWIVAPIAADLAEQEIGNLAFVMPAGLRSLPVASLHDGTGFVVEQYSVGLMPSISLTDLRYVDVRDTEVLAMGASQFQDQPDLPAVPLELTTIANQLWPGDFLINETFTPDSLVRNRAQKPYGIVHLATHGDFQPGNLDQSYIQFWDSRLSLQQVRSLQLNSPPVQLMVLSACRTALGNEDSELGFAGLAVQAGVKTALASLWKVDDIGTAGLMTQFYSSLRQEPMKAEALRQAQLAMIQGDIQIQAGSLVWSGGSIPLPPELVAAVTTDGFEHPYFWSAFTVIGSPW